MPDNPDFCRKHLLHSTGFLEEIAENLSQEIETSRYVAVLYPTGGTRAYLKRTILSALTEACQSRELKLARKNETIAIYEQRWIDAEKRLVYLRSRLRAAEEALNKLRNECSLTEEQCKMIDVVLYAKPCDPTENATL